MSADTTTHVRVAVIGGGIIGCSLLYHLAKAGWSDLLLVEGAQLTSGSTWHAAANGNTFSSSALMCWGTKRTFEIWDEIEEESGQEIGAHKVGGLMIARSKDRLDEMQRMRGFAQRIGVEYQMLSPSELKDIAPFMSTDTVLGAMFDPNGGHVDPYGLTQAYARAARKRGAQVWQNWKVTKLTPTAEGGWIIGSDKGEIHTEMIVNAAGMYADEVAKLTGARLPMVNMRHHYLISEPIPDVRDLPKEPPMFRDVDAGVYGRREGGGIMFGIYEQDSRDFGYPQMPEEFVSKLFDPDFDRLAPELEHVFKAIPCLAETGIRSTVHGPFVFTPDGAPLIGWMPGQRNHFAAAGFLGGITMSGGFGQLMAEWITEGAPHRDLSPCDVLRFGDWAIGDYAHARAHDTYSTRYKMHFPNEEIEAGRPVRRTPMYERFAALGAHFGVADGWERPNWFAGAGKTAVETPSFRRTEAHPAIAAECEAVRSSAGYVDLTSFANYLLEGPEAETFLRRALPGRVPAKIGRLGLTPIVNEHGGVLGDATILRLGEARFMLIASGALSRIHLRQLRPIADGLEMTLDNRTDSWSGFSVAGPNAGAIVKAALGGAEPPRFFGGAEMQIGGVDCVVLRLSYVGELSYEIHCSMTDQPALHDALTNAAADLELPLAPFGARAMNAMRVEKALPRTGDELTIESTPFELGMGWMLDLDRNEDFTGREALLALRNEELRYKMISVLVDETEIDPTGGEPVYQDGALAGYLSSASYGHRVGRTIGVAFLRPDLCRDGVELQIRVLGREIRGVVSEACAYDPEGVLARVAVG